MNNNSQQPSFRIRKMDHPIQMKNLAEWDYSYTIYDLAFKKSRGPLIYNMNLGINDQIICSDKYFPYVNE